MVLDNCEDFERAALIDGSLGLFINGGFKKSEAVYQNINPSTELPICSVFKANLTLASAFESSRNKTANSSAAIFNLRQTLIGLLKILLAQQYYL